MNIPSMHTSPQAIPERYTWWVACKTTVRSSICLSNDLSIDRSRQVGGGGRDSFVLLGLCENHVGL